MKSAFCALAVSLFVASCTTSRSSSALTPATVGTAFARHAVKTADRNRDGSISLAEWKAVGGTERGFAAIDRSGDGYLTMSEIKTASGTDAFFAFAKRTMDTGGNTELTPRSFRSPAGAKLFSYRF